MTMSLSVAVVAGGPSSEANVSRASASGVATALAEAGHSVRVVELDAALARALAEAPPDVVFPITHGPLGEDGCLQGLLEVLDLPYVGSGVLASALAASKPHAKLLFRAAGLAVAEELLVTRQDDLAASARRARERLGDAVVVKPASSGSAIGVTRVAGDAPLSELEGALETALALDTVALVERFAPGNEVTCGVLEDAAGVARALPPTLIFSKAADWYDFNSRYAAGGSEHACPAPLAEGLTERVQRMAVLAHRALGARDLSRVDFVVGEGAVDTAVTLLEVNTLPGMTATSLFPEAAAISGVPFPELCARLVRRAHARPRRQRPAELPMP
jgi:D-alanine-D-alanine ligase